MNRQGYRPGQSAHTLLLTVRYTGMPKPLPSAYLLSKPRTRHEPAYINPATVCSSDITNIHELKQSDWAEKRSFGNLSPPLRNLLKTNPTSRRSASLASSVGRSIDHTAVHLLCEQIGQADILDDPCLQIFH